MNNTDYEKLTRDQMAWFLDTKPKSTHSYDLLGFGVSSAQINYNNQITTEKWIINKNSTSSHESNQKQSDITQKCYKNEPCFEYLNGLRDKTGSAVESTLIEVDIWNGTAEESGVVKYPAKKSNVITPVSSFLGEVAEIGYSIHFNGDPVEGTVVITDGKAVFTANA